MSAEGRGSAKAVHVILCHQLDTWLLIIALFRGQPTQPVSLQIVYCLLVSRPWHAAHVSLQLLLAAESTITGFEHYWCCLSASLWPICMIFAYRCVVGAGW
jgi:hypothetical protein